MDRGAHVDAQSASSQPVQPHGGPRAPGYAPLCAGPSAPSGLPTPAVLPSLSKRVHVAGPEGLQQPPPLPVASHLVFPNAAGLNPHFPVQFGGLGCLFRRNKKGDLLVIDAVLYGGVIALIVGCSTLHNSHYDSC